MSSFIEPLSNKIPETNVGDALSLESLISTLKKPSTVVHTCNPGAQREVKVGRSAQGHPQLHGGPAWATRDRERDGVVSSGWRNELYIFTYWLAVPGL